MLVNGAFLFVRYKERGRLNNADYVAAAKSLGTTLALMALITLVFSRFGPGRDGETPKS